MIAFKLGSPTRQADWVCFSLTVPQRPRSAPCHGSSPVQPLTSAKPARDNFLARQMLPPFVEQSQKGNSVLCHRQWLKASHWSHPHSRRGGCMGMISKRSPEILFAIPLDRSLPEGVWWRRTHGPHSKRTHRHAPSIHTSLLGRGSRTNIIPSQCLNHPDVFRQVQIYLFTKWEKKQSQLLLVSNPVLSSTLQSTD